MNRLIQNSKFALKCALCCLFICTAIPTAFGQWKLASGFSNSISTNNLDAVSGFVAWGNNLLADAKCGIDLLQPPGATPDSLFLSTDNGQSWLPFAPNGGTPLIAVGSGQVPALIGAAETSPTHTSITDEVLSYSLDAGQTWSSDTTQLGGSAPNSLATIGSTIFASEPFAVHQQTAPGAPWTLDTSGLELGGNISSVGTLLATGNNLFVSTLFNGIFRSTNMGASWATVNTGLPTVTSSGIQIWLPANQFAVSGSSIYAMVSHDIVNMGADPYSLDFYRTMDNGQNWTLMNNTPENKWGSVYKITAAGQDLFAATDSGFFASTNGGTTWAQADQGLQVAQGDFPTSVQISGPNIVISTGTSGVWTRKLSDFVNSSVSTTEHNVKNFSLSTSYPNPMTSTTTIEYSLKNNGIATLKLYDVTGQEIRVLSQGYQSSGAHSVILDGSSLPAGVYFYRLSTDGQSAGNSMQIIR